MKKLMVTLLLLTALCWSADVVVNRTPLQVEDTYTREGRLVLVVKNPSPHQLKDVDFAIQTGQRTFYYEVKLIEPYERKELTVPVYAYDGRPVFIESIVASNFATVPTEK